MELMSTQTTQEAKHTPEWILYQIGTAEQNGFRFVVTSGFQDDAVEKALAEGEFIDTTSTLLGALGGDVTVLADAVLAPGVKRIHADELLAYVKGVREQMGNTGFFFDFLANGCVALWYQSYAKRLEELLPKDKVQLKEGWPETDHIYARAASRIAELTTLTRKVVAMFGNTPPEELALQIAEDPSTLTECIELARAALGTE